MADSRMSEAIQQLRSVALLCDGAEPTDGQLLEAFLSRRDAAALTAIVSRHAPMVWGVCRRILRNDHDAEDAFQAAFLVLVRRAASIASRDLLANWLYAVACRTARKARATAARRRTREKQVAQMPEPTVDTSEPQLDLRSLLDQELSSLGDKYRALVVLCDLEGKTRAEAARELGCPEGTVAGRLARAREMLAKRLARRGVMVSGAALAAALAQEGAACAPAAVLSSAIKAACLVAAEPAAISAAVSPAVAALTEGVWRTMFVSRLKTLAIIIVAVGLLAGAAGWIGLQSVARDRPNADRLVQEPEKKKAEPEAENSERQPGGKDAPKAQGKVMPPDTPLVAVLKANKDTYQLELGGLSTEQFRNIAEGSTDFGAGGPPTPVVDLVLEVRNTSDKPIQLFTMPDLAIIVLVLTGPDALTIRHEGPIDLDRRLPKTITLEPGQVFTRPIRNFDHGARDLEFRTFWFAPGEYTLTAEFQTAILPAPPGALVYGGGLGEPQLKGFGEVTVTTPPLTLKVTDGKDAKKQGQNIRPTKNLTTGYIVGEEEVKLRPPNGFITKKEDFANLWKVWLLDDKVPAVDFKTHLIVVATSREGPIKTAALFDEKKTGDMKIKVELERKTKNDGKGIYTLIAVFPRAGIKSIEGRAVAAP